MSSAPPAPAATPPPAPPVSTGQGWPTIWPSVIGIIAIILGSLAMLQGCTAAAFAPFIGLIHDLMIELSEQAPGLEPSIAQLRVLEDYTLQMVVGGVLGLGLALMILIGGVGLTRRRGWAPRCCLVWGVLKMLLAVVTGLTTWQLSVAQFEAMAEASRDMVVPGAPPEFYESMIVMAPVFGVGQGLFLCVFPVFLLVWLGRAKIRAETAGWKTAGAEPPT